MKRAFGLPRQPEDIRLFASERAKE